MTLQWGPASEATMHDGDDPDAPDGLILEDEEVALVSCEAVIYGLPVDMTALGVRTIIAFGGDMARAELVVDEFGPGDSVAGHRLSDDERGVELVGVLGGGVLVAGPDQLAALGAYLLAAYGGQ